MDKKTPKSKKTDSNVIGIKAVPTPTDMFTADLNEGKREKLQKVIENHKLLIVTLKDNPICLAFKGKQRKIQTHNPFAVTGPKDPIVEMNLPDMYAIDLVVEPSYIKMTNSKKRWLEELTKNKTYHAKKKFWENLGVKYIIDFDVNSINKEL